MLVFRRNKFVSENICSKKPKHFRFFELQGNAKWTFFSDFAQIHVSENKIPNSKFFRQLYNELIKRAKRTRIVALSSAAYDRNFLVFVMGEQIIDGNFNEFLEVKICYWPNFSISLWFWKMPLDAYCSYMYNICRYI